MTTFSSRSRCGRKQLNRHFRFSWDSTSCPTSSVWGSFYHKSGAVFPTHTEILTVLHNIGYLLLLCRPEALKRSLGNSVWSWCSQTSLYRFTRRPGQHPELRGEGNVLGLLAMSASRSPTPSYTGCFVMPGHSCLDAKKYFFVIVVFIMTSV